MTITEIIGYGSAILSAIGGTGYFTAMFMKARYKQEVEKLKVEVLQTKKNAETTDIENDKKVVDLYKSALDDLEVRYEKKFADFEQSSNKKLSDLEALFAKKEEHLMKEIEFHAKQSALYEKMYNEKVREIAKLKREHK